MNEKIVNQNIDRLDISCNSIQLLKDNKIIFIKQVCKMSKKELKSLGLLTNEIRQIELQLQLQGLNLNTKY